MRRHSSTNSVKIGSCMAASMSTSGREVVSRWHIIRTRCRFDNMSRITDDSPAMQTSTRLSTTIKHNRKKLADYKQDEITATKH